MISDQNNAEWVSVTYEQQGADTDWVEWQGEIITPIIDLGYSQADSTASLLYFAGWESDYSGETLLVEQGGIFQQEVMPAGNLSGAISNASYDNVSFGIGGQEGQPVGLAFSPDGTKMFIVGFNTDTVYQYTLTTGFDLSTASYDSVSFSVAGQDSEPNGLAFSPDGTKMFVGGADTYYIYQYTLSTGFDLSTASHNFVNLYVANEDPHPMGITFNSDGTKMFMMGGFNGGVHQYTLTTGFDLSTASYDSVSFDVGGQESNPYGLAFSPDGTKMFMVGIISDNVHQYTLTTGFDLSTASYDSVSFSPAGQDGSSRGVAFSKDGTKMLIMGYNTDTVYQYSTNFNSTYSVSLASTPTLVTSIPSVSQHVCLATTDATAFVTDKEFPAVSATTTSITLDYDNNADSVVSLNDSIVLQTSGATVSITDIVVSGGQTTISFSAQPNAPTSAILPSWATTYTPVSYTESNGNIVQRSDRILTDNGKRFAKFKLVGDEGQEVSNAKINLWKEV